NGAHGDAGDRRGGGSHRPKGSVCHGPAASGGPAEPGRRRGQTARRAGLEAAIRGPADDHRSRVELRSEARGEIEKAPPAKTGGGTGPPTGGVGVGHARPQGRGYFAEFAALTTS